MGTSTMAQTPYHRGSSDPNLWSAIDNVRDDVAAIDKRTGVHEAVCAERYLAIQKHLRIIMVMIGLLFIGEAFGLGQTLKAALHLFGFS